MRTIHLRDGGVSVVIDLTDDVPAIVWWREELADGPEDFLRLRQPWVQADRPDRRSVPLVPTQADGWTGTPGLAGYGGRSAFPRLRLRTHHSSYSEAELVLSDEHLGLELTVRLGLTGAGLLRVASQLRNTSAIDFELSSVQIALPVGDREDEVLDLASRSNREHHLQRQPLTMGRHARTTRVSRGQRGSAVVGACTPGAGWRSGSVRYVHLAWSGNTELAVEHDPVGMRWLQAGELLLPGEVVLRPGETYEAPELLATWGIGLDAAAARIHDHVRALPSYPHSARPVTLNGWEAVYYDHSLERLLPILDVAKQVGVERFVLDDGWFSTRRDDTSGLGDWSVSDEVWPEGLAPLVDAVRTRGMQFGLWVEPESVNEESHVARAHPEWLCAPGGRTPPSARHQQVLNLAIPEARQHVLDGLSKVIAEHHVDYLKWDMNRDVLEAADRATGRTVARQRVVALYDLVDELRTRFGWLEIEACASGGGRLDLGMLARAQRLWPSDCIDPLERLAIVDGVSLLLPPELVGTHIASPTSHSTGRTHSLSFRGSVALVGHLGIEWDLATLTEAEIDGLRDWVAMYRTYRGLMSSGTLVHLDCSAPFHGHGVVSGDGDQALYVVAATATSTDVRPPMIALPGLDPVGCYRIELVDLPEPDPAHRLDRLPPWCRQQPLICTGAQVGAGIAVPVLRPEQSIIIHLTRVTP